MMEVVRILIGILVLVFTIDESSSNECHGDSSDYYSHPSNDHTCWQSLDVTKLDQMVNNFFLYNRGDGSVNECTDDVRQTICWGDDVIKSTWRPKTFVVIHGWRSRSDGIYMKPLCDALLQMEDANVIMVDWRTAADNINYFESRLESRLVAMELASLLRYLHTEENMAYADVHIIGHSLGAHLAGYTGDFIGESTIGRITGLDPASPNFKNFLNDAACVLDKTDAIFVDVIHSDGWLHLLGLKASIGHQDFYPNKGCLMQPRCSGLFGCSHMRAIDFFISSIKNKDLPDGDSCSFKSERYDWFTPNCRDSCPRLGIMAKRGPENWEGSFQLDIDEDNCGFEFLE